MSDPTNCKICNIEIDDTCQTVEDQPVCDNCYARINDYAQRVENRIDRLQARAQNTRRDAEADTRRGRDMFAAIPFGQPMMVDHHSYKRDRNYRLRADNLMRRGFEKFKRAQNQQQRAQAAASNRAISSDDPAAVIKLEAKLNEAIKAQETMKRLNRITRKALRASDDHDTRVALVVEEGGVTPENAERLLEGDYMGRVGFPDYRLKNNNANIRRMKARLDELRAQAARAATTNPQFEHRGELVIERNHEDNRIRIIFPGKPDAHVRKLLKGHGFRWSRHNGAWQRHLNNAGEYALSQVLKTIEAS